MSLGLTSSPLVDRPSARASLQRHTITTSDRLRRAVWNVIWLVFGRPSPKPAHAWRCFVLRRFGAQVGAGVHVYPSAKIWAPWKLKMEARSCLADGVNCYNVAALRIGEDVVISQDAYLCTATHDYNDRSFPLLVAPIDIGSHAWVAAGAFLAPGITVHRGAVVGARSVVTASVPAWSVVAGNPARFVKSRVNFEA
jgi:putative colanic acid biosynthesis acetyltransferase WcaF